MPAPHRDLVKHFRSQIAQCGTIHDFVRDYGKQKPGAGALKDKYNACLSQLAQFRGFHMTVAKKYLGEQTNTGTGASSFKDMLHETLEDTIQTKLSSTD